MLIAENVFFNKVTNSVIKNTYYISFNVNLFKKYVFSIKLLLR